MKSGRTSCCVPFCGKTRRADGRFSEWLCMDHWRLVSARTKKWKRLAERTHEKAKAGCAAITAKADEYATRNNGLLHMDLVAEYKVAAERRDEAQASCTKAWERCRAEAIEKAGGIR